MNKVQESKLENKPELGCMSVLPTETKIQQRKKKNKPAFIMQKVFLKHEYFNN